MAELLQALINVSEKAANVARTIRHEEKLFEMLIEEKKDGEKNQRFFQDFKTLADVLIQEMVRHDIGKKFPEIAAHIQGEESNKFTNLLGETVIVEIKPTKEQTAEMLSKVLGENPTAVTLLTDQIHSSLDLEPVNTIASDNSNLPLDNLGIWIDPIDSTAEYIHGKNKQENSSDTCISGLQCVTVLLGVFNRVNGQPVLGVVNQPFHEFDAKTNIWKGKCFWGISFGDSVYSSFSKSKYKNKREKPIIIMSTTESDSLKASLEPKFEVVFAAGAGYKQLCVTLNTADAYILSKASTFKWDTCAPHAVLRTLGGGVVSYHNAVTSNIDTLNKDTFKNLELCYHKPDKEGLVGVDEWCNSSGLIAFRDLSVLKEILQTLQPTVVTSI